MRSLMAMRVVHCLPMKFSAVISPGLAASGIRPVVAMAIIEVMIDVSVEMSRSVIPRPCADEYAVREPFRAIVAVWSAVVGRNLVIAVRALRSYPYAYRNLRGCTMACSQEKGDCASQNARAFQSIHSLTSNRVRCRRQVHVVNIAPEDKKGRLPLCSWIHRVHEPRDSQRLAGQENIVK